MMMHRSEKDEVGSRESAMFGKPLLTVFQSILQELRCDFYGMRRSLKCRICFQLLEEPFTVGCGHTFCYSVRYHPSNRVAFCAAICN